MIFQLQLFAALSFDSCAANPVGPAELTSTDALVQALVQQGAAVARAGAMPASAYPFFSVNAKRIVLNGADVQVFEYSSAARRTSTGMRRSLLSTFRLSPSSSLTPSREQALPIYNC